MAPTRTQKQNTSASSEDIAIPTFPAVPTNARTIVETGTSTPDGNVVKSSVGITRAQKQALVDNLQLEITERARKLRAQYALQAQGLRARLELRVNRIPQSLRKRNMQDLLEEHAAKAKPAPPPPMPVASTMQSPLRSVNISTQPYQSVKRKSDAMSNGDDKENIPSQSSQELANPKKRTRTAPPTTAAAKPTRTASRKGGPTAVLSPRSHNSRTLPRSPLKDAGMPPQKTQTIRPVASTQTAAPKQPARAPSRQVKRPAPVPEAEGRSSEASNTSTTTTVVKRTETKKAPAPKKAATVKAVPVTRKPAAAKKEAAATVSIASGRTLRKRN